MPSFVRLVNKEFSAQRHEFWLAAMQNKDFTVEPAENVYIAKLNIFGQLYSYIYLMLKFHRAEKILLHGLFNARVLFLLACCPWLLSKCYWVIWGGDLYEFLDFRKRWQAKVKEGLKQFVIKRFGHLITYIEGDLELARKWYGARGEYHESLMYMSNVFDPSLIQSSEKVKKTSNSLHIMIGNSADQSNNHIEIFERLLPCRDRDVRIFVPLSYGDENYREQVIGQGMEMFGEKFVPLTSFIPFEEYVSFLSELDVAIFNHDRQQAMGNTIVLLGFGKTVYMRRDVTQWQLFSNLGIKVLDSEGFNKLTLSMEEVKKNKKKVACYFSKERLLRQYSDIFSR